MCISFLEGVTNHWFALLGRSLVENDCQCFYLMPRIFALANNLCIFFITQSFCFESRLFTAWSLEDFVGFQWYKLNRCTVTSFMCSGAAIKGSFENAHLHDAVICLALHCNYQFWMENSFHGLSSYMPKEYKHSKVKKVLHTVTLFSSAYNTEPNTETTILNLDPLNSIEHNWQAPVYCKYAH